MGLAIEVPGVNWADNNLGQVELLEPIAKNLYDKHLVDSGRPEDVDLLRVLNKLVVAGLHKKIKALYWLASSRNTVSDILFNVFNSDEKLTVNGQVLISKNGATPVDKGYLIDPASYNFAYGFATALVIPQASTLANSLDWGANGATSGNANYIASIPYGGKLARRGADADSITTADDNTSGGGVYVYSSNKDGKFTFKHNDKLTVKTASLRGLMVNPTILKFKDIANNTTNAVIKLYLTIDDDLTEAEVNKLSDSLK